MDISMKYTLKYMLYYSTDFAVVLHLTIRNSVIMDLKISKIPIANYMKPAVLAII